MPEAELRAGKRALAAVASPSGSTAASTNDRLSGIGLASVSATTVYCWNALAHLAGADPGLDAIGAAVLALTRGGLEPAPCYEYAKSRIEVLATTPELRERDLIKTARLTEAMADVLIERGVPARTASFAAQAAVAVFTVAAADWIATPTADFPQLMSAALIELRRAAGG